MGRRKANDATTTASNTVESSHSFDWKLERSKEKKKEKNEKEKEKEKTRHTGRAVFPFIGSLVGQQIRTYIHTYNSRESNRTGRRGAGGVRDRRMNRSNVPNNGGDIAEAAARRTPPKIQLEASDRIRAYRSNFQGSTGERVEPGRHAADHDWIKDTLRLRHASFRSRKPLATLARRGTMTATTVSSRCKRTSLLHSYNRTKKRFPPCYALSALLFSNPSRRDDDGFTSEQFIRPGLCLIFGISIIQIESRPLHCHR